MAVTALVAVIAAAAVGSAAYGGVSQQKQAKQKKRQMDEAQEEAHRQEVYTTAGDVARDSRDLHSGEQAALEKILEENRRLLV